MQIILIGVALFLLMTVIVNVFSAAPKIAHLATTALASCLKYGILVGKPLILLSIISLRLATLGSGLVFASVLGALTMGFAFSPIWAGAQACSTALGSAGTGINMGLSMAGKNIEHAVPFADRFFNYLISIGDFLNANSKIKK